MKIGVVSDTHSKKLPQRLIDDFKQVDLIIHLGDFCEMSDYKRFSEMKPTKAVCGNMDTSEVCRVLPQKQIVECGDCRLGLYHGGGAPNRILETVKKEFKDDKVDAVIFGHSHCPLNEIIDNVLYFNPGSPTDTIFAPYRSYGILEIFNHQIKGKIIKIEDKNG